MFAISVVVDENKIMTEISRSLQIFIQTIHVDVVPSP